MVKKKMKAKIWRSLLSFNTGLEDISKKILEKKDKGWPGGIFLSRSIGDTDVGEFIVPVPHAKQLKLSVPGGRLVIASHGIRDALSSDAAAKACRGLPTDLAAKLVVKEALRSRCLKDDTTCLVVDNIPSVHPVLPSMPQKKHHGLSGLLSGMKSHNLTSKSSKISAVGVVEELFEEGSAMLAQRETFPALDRRTGEVIVHVAEGDAEDINLAVAAAQKAFDEGPWHHMTAYERARIMLKFADLVNKHNEELAALETWDNRKPFQQALKSELPMLVCLFHYYAVVGWADKVYGLTVPADGPYHVQVLHEPIGVAGQIIPWNFPLIVFAWKVGPALACGNTIVLKTAEQTPLTALYVGKLFHEAGLPPCVLNIVSGHGPMLMQPLQVTWMLTRLLSQDLLKLQRMSLKLAAKSNLKLATLELGGKSPFIICGDADVDKAVELAHYALFFNQALLDSGGGDGLVILWTAEHGHDSRELVPKLSLKDMRRIKPVPKMFCHSLASWCHPRAPNLDNIDITYSIL